MSVAEAPLAGIRILDLTRYLAGPFATMLLAGIALGALAGALSGILVYMADDRQLRDLTFWGLGSLAGASWAKVISAGPLIGLSIGAALMLGRGLNGLALGEATAAHIGIDVQRMKSIAILAVAGATGAAVAVSGGIGFIGIVVPHLLRPLCGARPSRLATRSAHWGSGKYFWRGVQLYLRLDSPPLQSRSPSLGGPGSRGPAA